MHAAFFPALFKILRIQIGLPVGVILAVWLWVLLDRGSAVRRAVDAQANRFVTWVAQAQIAEVDRRRKVAVTALKAFQNRAHEADALAQEYERQIEEYTNGTQLHPSCVVSSDLLERLR